MEQCTNFVLPEPPQFSVLTKDRFSPPPPEHTTSLLCASEWDTHKVVSRFTGPFTVQELNSASATLPSWSSAPHLLTFLCPQFPNLYLQSWQDLQLIRISTTPDIHLPDKQLELNFAKAEFISSLLNLFLLCLPSAENDPTLSSVASVCSLYSFTYFPHPSH